MQYQPPYSTAPQPPPSKGIPSYVWIIALSIGGVILFAIVACGGAVAWVLHVPQASAAAKQPFDFKSIPLPAFPERGAPVELEPGMVRHTISLGPPGGYYSTPGHGGVLWLYLPAGEHPPKSLPCILIAGAGSTLMAGMSLTDGEDGDELEQRPYARAGCAVLAYELDGPELDDGEDDEINKSYLAFRASCAGLVNARNAIEYVLAKVPEVDPARIYSAGHSSAATLSLLFAEHEPRLAGCIAYAPVYDVPKHLTPMGMRALSMMMPGLVDFATQSSPSTHRQNLKCPVFLFHAEDDDTCMIDDTRAFEAQLREQGAKVTLVTVPEGGHYESMIDQGIPKGIEWLRQNGALGK